MGDDGAILVKPVERDEAVVNEANSEFKAVMAEITAEGIRRMSDADNVSVRINDTVEPTRKYPPSEHDMLAIEDLQELFGIGRSKASRLMTQLPREICTRVGKSWYVKRGDLEAYLAKHDDVSVDWNAIPPSAEM